MGKNWKQRSNLLAAVLGGDSEAVRLILAESPELRPFLDDGENPLLHTAASQGNAGAVRVLAEAGFDVNARDKQGRTPLLYAVDTNRLDCVFPLAEFGADVNATGDDGWAPLHLAVRNGNPLMVSALGWHKADPNVLNAVMGATPLHLAAYLDRDALVPQLMDLGSNPLLEDARGFTPAAVAAEESNWDVPRAIAAWIQEHPGGGSTEEDVPDEAEVESDDGILDAATEDDDVYTACDWCGRDILHGNACVSVARTIEQVEWNGETGESEIQVIDSETLLSLCAVCGNGLNTRKLRKRLVAKGKRVGDGRRRAAGGG